MIIIQCNRNNKKIMYAFHFTQLRHNINKAKEIFTNMCKDIIKNYFL